MVRDINLQQGALIGAFTLLAAASGLALGAGMLVVLAVFVAPLAIYAAWKLPGAVFALHLSIPYYKAGVDDYLPFDATALMAIWSVIATVPVVVAFAQGRLMRVQLRAAGVWLLPLGMVAFGTLYAVDRAAAVTDLVSFTTLVFGAGLLGLRVAANRTYLGQFVWTLLTVFVASVTAGFFGIGDLGSYERLQSLGSNTIFSARAGISAALIGVVYLWPKIVWRPVVLPLALVSVYVAMSTGSRGPLIMGLLTLALLWFVTTNLRTRMRHLILGLAAIVFITSIPLPAVIRQYVPEFALGRISNTIQNIFALLTGGRTNFDTSEQARITIWELAIGMFQSRPVTGWGTASFGHFTPGVALEHITYPHNLVLQFMAEFGAFGILVMLATFVPALRQSLRPSRNPLVTTVNALFIFNVMNAMVSSGLVDNRMLWGLLLLVLATPRQALVHQAPPVGTAMARHDVPPLSLTYSVVPAPPSSRR